MSASDWILEDDEKVAVEKARVSLLECKVPMGLHHGLIYHVLHGVPTGDFLTAVLKNDLKEACSRADYESARALYQIVFWLYNYAPTGCWGSLEQMNSWRLRGGFKGIQTKQKESQEEQTHG